VRADEDDAHLEGTYWLALIAGPAFVVPQDMLCEGEQFDEGYLVAPAQWYKLEQTSERGYVLLAARKHLVVNSMIRLKDVQFNKTPARPHREGVNSRYNSPTGKLSYLCEDMHNTLLACV
jgi:hypothetical protein